MGQSFLHKNLKESKQNFNLQCVQTEAKNPSVADHIIVETGPITLHTQVYYYFEVCFNILHALFFMPFRVRRIEDNSLVISTSYYRKIICSIIHPIVCLNSILEIRGAARGKVREHPEVFFKIGERLTSALYIFIFVRIVWFRRDRVFGIFKGLDAKFDLPQQDGKVSRSIKIFWLLYIPFSIFSFVAKFISEEFQEPNFYQKFDKFIETIQFEMSWSPVLPAVQDSTTTISSVVDSYSSGLSIFSGILLAIRLYKWVLIDCIAGLCLIISFASFNLAKEFKSTLVQSEIGLCEQSEEHVLNFYSKVKENCKKISAFLGPFFVISFLSLITFFSVGLVEIMDADSWCLKIRLLIYNLVYFFLFIFAAEAHYQASYLRTWLLTRPKNTLRHVSIYLDMDNGNIGLTGGRFFTLTYGFLGTAASIILTYAIITIQFGDPQIHVKAANDHVLL